MRLINTTTLQFEDFPNEAGLEYVILSHRWEEEEVSFQDMKSSEEVKRKKGYEKLSRFCQEASREGFVYAWIDTCCIDKTSSAELSEAINSMFRWYRNARVCYAFLSDVGTNPGTHLEEFRQSKWFTRGWTLQELLAPKVLHFYNATWMRFSSRYELVSVISEITGINKGALQSRNLFSFSTAQRMCWAAHRKTTRIEDRAYSLMGLFNVNMPMLYGEGNKAFLRLQEEIIRRSHDLSILAWSGVPPQGSGLLSDSPEHFVELGWGTNVFPSEANRDLSITNRGLSTLASLTPWTNSIYLMRLLEAEHRYAIGFFLRRLHDGRYRRVRARDQHDILYGREGIDIIGRTFRDVRIYVEQDDLMSHLMVQPSYIPDDLEYGVRINTHPDLDLDRDVFSQGHWNPETKIATLRPGQFGTVVRLDLRKLDRYIEWVRLGFSFDGNLRSVLAGTKGWINRSSSHLERKTINAAILEDDDVWTDYVGSGYVKVKQCPELEFVETCGEKWALQIQSQSIPPCGFQLLRNTKNGTCEVCKVVFRIDEIETRAIWAVDIDI